VNELMKDGFDHKRAGFTPIEEDAALFITGFERVSGGMWRRTKDGALYTRVEALRELHDRHDLLRLPDGS
jgi:hypothetical protein